MQTPKESAPLEIETGAAPACAVIWLHGLGADGYDFEPVVPELGLPADLAVRFVFPHAPYRPITINAGYVMRGWYDIARLDRIADEDAAGIRASEKILQDLIQRELDRGIAHVRIVVAGFSQGGAIALHTGLRFPQRLAGILALSTYLPLASMFAAEAHAANQATPVFMAHGTRDPMIPFALARASAELLQAHGVNLEFHPYAMEHSVIPEEMRDIGVWLARVLRGPYASTG